MKRLAALLTALILLTGCDIFGGGDDDGPAAPDDRLVAAFTWLLTPSAVASDGRCSLVIEDASRGGEQFRPNESSTPYANTWRIAWRDQANDLRGYPDGDTVRMELPDSFGPGSFPIDLTIEDRRGTTARAESNPPLDCSAGEQSNGNGS